MSDPMTSYAAMISRLEPGPRMIDGSLLKAVYQHMGLVRLAALTEPGPRLLDESGMRAIAAFLSEQAIVNEFPETGPRLIDGADVRDLVAASAQPFYVDVPAITGTATVGSTLTATTGNWTGAPTTYAYQWHSNGVNVGTNQNTYVVQAGDAGHSITCTVTATNAAGSTAAPPSNAIAIPPAAPTNTVTPAVTGTPAVGQTLTCSTGTWTGSPTGYTYQWRKVPVANIAGATSSTYVVQAGDAASDIYCNVTATNAGGSATVPSNTVTIP